VRVILSALALILSTAGTISAQSTPPEAAGAASETRPPVNIALGVPAGTPLRVVLDKEVRIRKAGQPIHAKIAEPVYAYDKLVVPAGSEVSGSVTRMAGVSASKRIMTALDANFSPTRDVEITFDQLRLPDGRSIAVHTKVSPGSQGVLQFAIAADVKNEDKTKKKNAVHEMASTKVSEKKQEISQEWNAAKQQIAAPGKLHRVKRIVIAELPFHPQYFDAGTRFNAELLDPLDFGTEQLSPETIRMVGTAPADGSIIHALLKTPLDSASSAKGETVEALMTEPLLAGSQLVLPEGTVLKGSVLQVQPARNLHRNGQLRIVFHEIIPPQSVEQHVEASLEGVEVKGDQNLSLDSEGGAQATSSNTRYLKTGIALGLAAVSFLPDSDPGSSGQAPLEIGGRAANGASGFKVIGFAMGALVRSRPLASGLGAYGASMSVYNNFLSRGHDVVYPKDTAMAIGFGSRVTNAPKSGASDANPTNANALTASK
jgi:hypothetical protein